MSLDRLGGLAKSSGGDAEEGVHDDEAVDTLKAILKELKQMNRFLAYISDFQGRLDDDN